MTGLTLKFENTSLHIAILQPFRVFFHLKFLFILLILLKRLFIFGMLELLTMFVMAVKTSLVNFSIFMNVSLPTFMFDFLWMNFKWVFFVFLMLPSLNYILTVGLLCKLFVFYVNTFHCLIVREFFFITIVLSLTSNQVGYL